MPLYGPCGQPLKVSHRRKSLRDLRKRKRRIGSALGVKRGLKNASENALPSGPIFPVTCTKYGVPDAHAPVWTKNQTSCDDRY